MFASVALAFSGPAPAIASNSALVVGGIDAPSLHDLILRQLLGGSLQDQDRVSVNWPAQAGPYTGKNDMTLGASINIGITNLNAQIDAAMDRLATDGNGNYINGEKVTVVGLSAGSLVVNEVLRQLAADANAPDKNQITFVLVADSSRQKLIDKARYNSRYDYTYQPAPETEYDIIVVTGEYDGMADFPDRWWNGLAVMNAIAGGIFVHVPMMFADLSKVPEENISVDVNSKGGTTTNYLVPTAKLPLVQMFPFLAAKEAELKAKIDKAYKRNDVPTAASLRTLATAAVAAEPEPEAEAAVGGEVESGASGLDEAAESPADTGGAVPVDSHDGAADGTEDVVEDEVGIGEVVEDEDGIDEVVEDEDGIDEVVEDEDGTDEAAEEATEDDATTSEGDTDDSGDSDSDSDSGGASSDGGTSGSASSE
ncbi:PE-PPE domain-containing protein [Mycobacterium sp. smrl_JER01]|uniref:PE-PPE domain-containing protein n=1 Tax=Mycobacterium sp. smrl_JER01 TaxID=3402633 RepID=UPI003AC959A2